MADFVDAILLMRFYLIEWSQINFENFAVQSNKQIQCHKKIELKNKTLRRVKIELITRQMDQLFLTEHVHRK